LLITIVALGLTSGNILLWDSVENEVIRTLAGHTSAVKVLKHTSRDHLVSGSDDNTVRAWNARTNASVCTIAKHKDWIRDIEIVDDSRIVSASDDGSIRFTDTSSCEETGMIAVGHYVLSLKLIHNRQLLAAGCQDSTIRVFNLTNENELVFTVTMNDTSGFEVRALAFLNETFLISGDDQGRINIWNTTSWALVTTLHDVFSASIMRMKIFKWNNTDFIMSSDSKGIVRVWDLRDYTLKFKLDSSLNVGMYVDVFPEKSQLVGISYDGTVKFWLLNKTENVETLKINLNYYAGVYTFLKLDPECKLFSRKIVEFYTSINYFKRTFKF
jgi:WD40 repeat protein